MLDSTEELLRQIQLGEDSSLELKDLRYRGEKVVHPHRNSMADELAAIANAFTGVVVLGVDDQTRAVTGIPVDKLDTVEAWVREICADLITPQLYCRIRKLPVLVGEGEEKAIIRVDVPRSLYVHQSPGGYFRRVGSAKRQMPPEDLARLFQQRSQARIIRFDEQSVPAARIEDLAIALTDPFRTELSPQDEREFLLKLRLVTRDEDGVVLPTVAGVLFATEDPSQWLPHAYVQAVSYRGVERNAGYQTDALDITGPLPRQIADACQFVLRHMRTAALKQPARVDLPQYSIQAVFEAIVNAVAHRDYSVRDSKIRLHMFADRLELYSPGTIPNTMTVDMMPFQQASRNDLIASLLARCPMPDPRFNPRRTCLMDRRGEGVPIILTESEKLSRRRAEYRLIDDRELMLTMFAAEPPLTPAD